MILKIMVSEYEQWSPSQKKKKKKKKKNNKKNLKFWGNLKNQVFEQLMLIIVKIKMF